MRSAARPPHALRGLRACHPAVAAAWLWVVVYAYWYSAIADGRAHGFRRSGLFIDVGAAQNALLLAAAWVAERFRRTAA